MIVATREDEVELSGALVKNHWLTIKAAATRLLEEHPQGIIIDCAGLTHISEDGAKTFLEAMKDIQAAGARIIVVGLPDNVLQVIRNVPGVRSQLPIAATAQDARASLRLGGASRSADPDRAPPAGGIVAPLLPGMETDYTVSLAVRLAREIRAPLQIVYLMEVARHLPLQTPLPDAEANANRALEIALGAVRKQNIHASAHLERVRDAGEGILQVATSYRAAHIVLGLFPSQVENESFYEIVHTVLRRAPCNVLIGRKALGAAQEREEKPRAPATSRDKTAVER